MSETPDLDDLPHAVRLQRAAERDGRAVYGAVPLAHAERIVRRRRLVTAADEGFYVTLDGAAALDEGDAFELADGRLVVVVAAPEPVADVSGTDLPTLAWHLGNRHTPIQTGPGRLVVRADPTLEAMLVRLGATVTPAVRPFLPVGAVPGFGHASAERQAADGGGGRMVMARTAAPAPEAEAEEVRPDGGPFA